jgi:hypothetical protein
VEEVKRRFTGFRIKLVLGSALALIAVIALTLSVKRYREPQFAPPEALAHIAQKNREAAVIAAAHQRAESAVSTNRAEDIAEAELRGREAANAALARFPNGENSNEAAGRQD